MNQMNNRPIHHRQRHTRLSSSPVTALLTGHCWMRYASVTTCGHVAAQPNRSRVLCRQDVTRRQGDARGIDS